MDPTDDDPSRATGRKTAELAALRAENAALRALPTPPGRVPRAAGEVDWDRYQVPHGPRPLPKVAAPDANPAA